MNQGPLRILLTDPHSQGGGQVRYVANLAAALRAMGHDIIVGCRPGSVLIEHAHAAGARPQASFHFARGLRLRAWGSDIRAARNFIASERPDIIHVSGSQDHWAFAFANRLLGRPSALVRTRHNTYPVSANPANRLLNRTWTDYQIVVCDSVRCDLARNSAFDPARMCSIHNGVDISRFHQEPQKRQRLRNEFGFDDSHIVVGIAARLVEAKGHVFLFEAMARLKDRLPQLRALVLGQGNLEESLKSLVCERGLTERVVFAGFRDDMADCVQAFDIGVQPSIDCDTSSFALKEQMAAGKPVIASDYGGLTEIVTDGVEGLVVPAGSIEPLATALERLAADPDLRMAMGERGRRRVEKEFSLEVFATRTVEAYRKAMELHGERSAH